MVKRSAALVVCLAALLVVPAALADGDPASDYLISAPVFVPIDKPVKKEQAAEFTALVLAAQKGGLQLKVAVIATKYDLGSIPILFGQPQRYSKFLGQELFYFAKHELLVVMPGGYGLYNHGHPVPAADAAAIAALPPANSTDGSTLVAAAMTAVRAIAQEHHVKLPAATPAKSKRTSSNRTRLELAGALWLVLAVIVGLGVLHRKRREASA